MQTYMRTFTPGAGESNNFQTGSHLKILQDPSCYVIKEPRHNKK